MDGLREGYRKENGVSGSLLTRISLQTHTHTHRYRNAPSHPLASNLDIEMIPWEINHISIGW